MEISAGADSEEEDYEQRLEVEEGRLHTISKVWRKGGQAGQQRTILADSAGRTVYWDQRALESSA